MNNIIKLSLIFTFAFLVMAALPTNSVSAWGSSCGSCEGDPDGDHDRPDYVKPVAVCKFLRADKTSLPAGGGNVQLSWKAVNATKVTLTGFGDVKKENTRTVFVRDDKTFVLTAYGTGGNDTCTVKVKVATEQPKPAAVCKFLTANKTSLPAGGGNVQLSWKTVNATRVTLTGLGDVAAANTRNVSVTADKTFVLTAYGTGGNDTCTVKVKVATEQPKPAAVCKYLTADKTTVPAGGGNVKLSWATKNATSVAISGIGAVQNEGSKTVFVNNTKTFTLTAKGTGGNDSCAVTVKVQNEPVEKPAVCEFLVANKTWVKEGGENVTLSWATKNATSVSISGIGAVAKTGSKTVFVNSNRTYTLTAVGSEGNDTCGVTIKVKDTPNTPTPSCDYFRVENDDNIEVGDKVLLEWATTDADQVRISPDLGIVSNDGSEYVTIDDEYTVFTLTARNLDTDEEDTCTVTVRADEDEDENEDDDEDAPRCDLEVSKSRANRGDRVTLSWETSDADRVRITDDHGKTIVNTTKSSLMDGEIDLIINETTEFTLNARGDGGSRNCRVTVKTDDIAVYEKRDQGFVIALTQVPYTGFEAGPTLTLIFYALLTLWALFTAYVLVIKKGSILGFSFYKNAGITDTDLENRKKVEALVAKYTGRNW